MRYWKCPCINGKLYLIDKLDPLIV